MNHIKETIIYILLFLWQLPQNLVALAWMGILWLKAPASRRRFRKVRFENYCLCLSCDRMQGGVSLGSFIIISPAIESDERLIRHEYGHVVDSHRMGPLYLFIIGIPSFIWCTAYDSSRRRVGKDKIAESYFDFYTERRADHNAGLS
jgi:hypothetical protein